MNHDDGTHLLNFTLDFNQPALFSHYAAGDEDHDYGLHFFVHPIAVSQGLHGLGVCLCANVESIMCSFFPYI